MQKAKIRNSFKNSLKIELLTFTFIDLLHTYEGDRMRCSFFLDIRWLRVGKSHAFASILFRKQVAFLWTCVTDPSSYLTHGLCSVIWPFKGVLITELLIWRGIWCRIEICWSRCGKSRAFWSILFPMHGFPLDLRQWSVVGSSHYWLFKEV